MLYYVILIVSKHGGKMQDYWDRKFDELNEKFWNGRLKKIPVYVTPMDDTYGLYYHPSASCEDTEQEIYLDSGMSHYQKRNILLHEMAHHYVFETYGDTFYHVHCKPWKDEMKRLGFRGKITKYTGLYKTREM